MNVQGKAAPVPHEPRKLVIQMSGAPGSGKSTTARLIAEAVNGVIIDHDIIRSTVLDQNIPFDDAAKLAYNLGWALAEDIMKQERTVILDSTCNFQVVVDKCAALALHYGHKYWYIECKVDDIGILDERLRKRAQLRSQRRGVDIPPPDAGSSRRNQDHHSLFRKWIESPCRPDTNCIILDASKSLEKYRDGVLGRIFPADVEVGDQCVGLAS